MCKLFPLIFITFGGADIRISIWTQWKVHKYWSSIFFHPCNIQRHLVVRRLFFSSGSAKRFCAKLSFWAAITPSPSPLPCCPCWGSSAEVAPCISRLNRLCQCFLWWWWKCMQDNTPPMHTDISISQQYFMQKWGGSRCCWGRVTAPQSKQETPPQQPTIQIRLQCNVPSPRLCYSRVQLKRRVAAKADWRVSKRLLGGSRLWNLTLEGAPVNLCANHSSRV